MRTEIARHPGRVQPFTVWVDGEVVGFAKTRLEAKTRLKKALS